MADPERGKGSVLDSDLCVIGGEHFFIRGLIQIPVIGVGSLFAWNVWSSLSAESFERTTQMWQSPGRDHQPPYFGWLSTDLVAVYPSTPNLALNVHTRPIGHRPLLELEPTDHPLAVEQRDGITLDRVREINERMRHLT